MEESEKSAKQLARDQIARLLDGHELGDFDDVVAGVAPHAKRSGFVIVFGASDDLMEFRGAINDEVSCWTGGSADIADGDLLTNDCDSDDRCPYFAAVAEKAFRVEALWDDADPDDDTITTEVWTYRLGVEHSTFTTLEDGEPWCRGVVFALADVETAGKETR